MENVETGQSATTQLLKKSKKKAIEPALVGSDTIVEVAKEIENLTEEQANAAVVQLLNSAGMNDFRLGGVLSLMQRNGWFDGYDSFRGMVEAKFGLHYRKAMYLVTIYNHLVENQISWEKVKDLGWTKLNEIAHILTAENVDAMVLMAQGMTVLQLREYVKNQQKPTEGEAAQEGETVTSTVTTLTFKVHADQKETVRHALDKAKAELSTEYDTVALEGICTGYLGGTLVVSAASVSLKDVMEKHSYEEVLQVFEQCFPDVDLTVTA